MFAGHINIYIPKKIKARERIGLALAGRRDAKDGAISLDEDGFHGSQYLLMLRSEAQRGVDTNVTATGRELGGIQRRLEESHSNYNNLLAKYREVIASREAATAAASARRKGDEGVADGTLERRAARRVQQATAGMDQEQDRVFDQLCEVANEVAELLDLHRECLFLCEERVSLIMERYQSTCHIYLRAARMDGLGGVKPLDTHVIDAAAQSFSKRVASYDFTRHLNVNAAA